MDSKQGPPGPPGPRRPRGYSFFNPPPAPLPPGYSNNPFLGPMHNTTGPMTNRSYAPLPIHPSTSAPQTPAHHIPAPIPRPDQDQSHIDRVQLSLRHIDDEVTFIARQVDDILRDPNLAEVREAGRRIGMANRLLRWNFERLLALNEMVKEENEKLKEEVKGLKERVGEMGEESGEETESADGVDTPVGSATSSDGVNDRAI